MEYQDIINEIKSLDFIENEEKADGAVKAVLGIMASRLREPQAHELTSKLPEPLSYERLRSHQTKTALMISFDEAMSEISSQFNLSNEQARTLANKILHLTKNALGSQVLSDLKSNLPPDWAQVLQEA